MSLYWKSTYNTRKFRCQCGKELVTMRNYDVIECECGDVEFLVYGKDILRIRRGKVEEIYDES